MLDPSAFSAECSTETAALCVCDRWLVLSASSKDREGSWLEGGSSQEGAQGYLKVSMRLIGPNDDASEKNVPSVLDPKETKRVLDKLLKREDEEDDEDGDEDEEGGGEDETAPLKGKTKKRIKKKGKGKAAADAGGAEGGGESESSAKRKQRKADEAMIKDFADLRQKESLLKAPGVSTTLIFLRVAVHRAVGLGDTRSAQLPVHTQCAVHR